MTQRKLRIEILDETGAISSDDYRTRTVAVVEVDLPTGMEVPGERLIEGARIAYRHLIGSDLTELLIEGTD